MPEPPTVFDLSQVNKQEVTPVYEPQDPNSHVIVGVSGAVPAGAVVRVTNLDQALDVAAINASDQGSFEIVVQALDGEELRLEWTDGARRSAPADAIFVRPDPASRAFQLLPSPRFECLRFEPGVVLDFAADAAQATLTLRNDCSGPVSVDNPRSRLMRPDFTLPDALPLEVAAGATAELVAGFTRDAPGLREDVLFVDVTLDAETIRYPITLRAE
jgi:hypothetical protein